MVARILGTCGGQFVFMLVSGAPAMAKLYPCLNRADLWWRHGIPACTWGTCGGTKRDLVKDRPNPSWCYQVDDSQKSTNFVFMVPRLNGQISAKSVLVLQRLIRSKCGQTRLALPRRICSNQSQIHVGVSRRIRSKSTKSVLIVSRWLRPKNYQIRLDGTKADSVKYRQNSP